MQLTDWLSHWARTTPHQAALAYEGRQTSYAALEQEVTDLAATLCRQFGIKPGDRIAWLGHNSPRVLEILFACARIGAILVPLNWRLAVPELEHVLRDARPRLLVVAQDQQQLAAALAWQPEFGRRVHAREGDGTVAWPVLQSSPALSRPSVPVGPASPDSALLILYTSGTTGTPKGVVLTQSALEWSARNSVAMHAMSAADNILMVLPMFHAGGFNIHTLPALSVGATLNLHPAFEPGRVLEELDRGQVTLTGLVPAQITAMVTHPGWSAADVSHVRCVTTGSTLVPDACLEAWRQRGVTALQVYGTTETCAVAMHQSPANVAATAGSVGFAAAHCRVRIVDHDGEAVEAGEKGEILISGPSLFKQYWGQPDATARALRDGWFHSGDIGLQRIDGSYQITDRKADLIISGGENIYPAELESVLAGHREIKEAAVIGEADERWGEVPVAFVVTIPGSHLTQDRVKAVFADRLAAFKCPRRVIFLDALPRNAMGKTEKFELRRLLTGAEEQL